MNIVKFLSSLILPITVTIIVPYAILGVMTVRPDAFAAGGFLLCACGVTIVILTISMFARFGRGTLAPWAPPKQLVISGVYSHVRNPMISGVLAILTGESLVFHSLEILTWAAIFFVFNNVYFLLVEEPGLEIRFGGQYLEYKKNVPMWIPRRIPWSPEHGPEPTGQ